MLNDDSKGCATGRGFNACDFEEPGAKFFQPGNNARQNEPILPPRYYWPNMERATSASISQSAL